MGLEFESPAGHQKAAERLLFCVPDGDSKTCNATVRWTVARATDAGLLASKAFGNLPDCKQHCAPKRDSNIFAAQKCKRSQAGHKKSSETNRFPNFFFYFQQQKIRVLMPRFFLVSNPLVTSSGSPKSSREAAFLRARWRFEDLQCDSPVDCRSRDRCRIACIKSIWQFAGSQTALRPRARLQARFVADGCAGSQNPCRASYLYSKKHSNFVSLRGRSAAVAILKL